MPNKQLELEFRNANQQIRAQEAEIEAFIARLESVYSRAIDQIASDLDAGEASAVEAANQLANVQSRLIEAGLDDAISDLEQLYADELRFLREELAEARATGGVFSQADSTFLETLIRFDVEMVRGQSEFFGDELRSQLLGSLLIGERPDFSAAKEAIGSRLANQMKTQLNTLLIGFQRKVGRKKADDLDLQLALYVGPSDKVTRPFCLAALGQARPPRGSNIPPNRNPPIYTKQEIDRFDNGQGVPASVFAGGYNCRHRIRYITENYARSLGYRP